MKTNEKLVKPQSQAQSPKTSTFKLFETRPLQMRVNTTFHDKTFSDNTQTPLAIDENISVVAKILLKKEKQRL